MGKIYRVRIEAYDPETEENEVILDEEEDNGYSGFIFFAREGEHGLRSVMQHVTTFDVASMLVSDEACLKAAQLAAAYSKFKSSLLKEDDGCLQ